MRLALAVAGIMLICQGLLFSIFIQVMRTGMAFLQGRNDSELRRVGVATLLIGVAVLVCVI